MEQQTIPIKVFYFYAYEDEPLQKELEKHLIILKRQGFITTWQSREVKAGTEWKREIGVHLNRADIILLLLSPDFIASEFCYQTEMRTALNRHLDEDARVIPILLRPVDWKNTPLSKLQVLPKSGKPITSWRNQYRRDKAFLEVALGIRDVITALKGIKMARNSKAAVAVVSAVVSDDLLGGTALDHAIAKVQADRAKRAF